MEPAMKSKSMYYYRVRSFLITITYIIGMLGFSVLFANPQGVTVFNGPSEGIVCPVIQYHDISADPGSNSELKVSLEELRKDIEFLKQKGFEPIFVRDLIDNVFDQKPLPNKPVIISFDNGLYSFYEHVFPILKEQNIKAAVSVMGYNTENSSNGKDKHAYLTWNEIRELYRSGFVEVENQSYNIDNEESLSADFIYRDALKLNKLLQEKSGVTPAAYTYSLLRAVPRDEDFLGELGFRASFVSEEGINVITGPESLYGLCRYCRKGGVDTETFMKKILDDMP
jgi:peptidoglycan/xylan/chitin deacetylase (PgdA/CDA1 family)